MPFKSLKLWGLLTILLTVLLMNNAEAVAQNAESSKQPASKKKKSSRPAWPSLFIWPTNWKNATIVLKEKM